MMPTKGELKLKLAKNWSRSSCGSYPFQFDGCFDLETFFVDFAFTKLTQSFFSAYPFHFSWCTVQYKRFLSECAEPLGMVSGLIPDSSIKASSFKDGGEPWRARLGHGSGWIPSSGSSSEYLEVDLGEPKVITSIEIEGDSHHEHWLVWFFLDYRMNSDEPWENYQPRGSSEVSILRQLRGSLFLKAICFMNPSGSSG